MFVRMQVDVRGLDFDMVGVFVGWLDGWMDGWLVGWGVSFETGNRNAERDGLVVRFRWRFGGA